MCGLPSLNGGFYNAHNLSSIPSGIFSEYTLTAELCFSQCSGLSSLPSDFSFSNNIENIREFFANTNIDNVNFNIPTNITVIAGLFKNCSYLSSICLNFFINDDLYYNYNINDLSNFFSNCTALSSLPSTFCLPHLVININLMFLNCKNLSGIANYECYPHIDKKIKVKSCLRTFYNCYKLNHILPQISFSPNSQYLTKFAYNCSSLLELPDSIWPINGFNQNYPIDIERAFSYCKNISGLAPSHKLWHSNTKFVPEDKLRNNILGTCSSYI